MNTTWKAIALGASVLMMGCGAQQDDKIDKDSLKEAFKGKFTVGAALNLEQIYGEDTLGRQVLLKHFNSIVAENCMKSMYMQPYEGDFFFDDADQFVALGEEHGMEIIGHTLIWHSQAPDWFFVDEEGQDVSREVLIERMRKHIHTIVMRYKGKVHGWDVVNEALLDNGQLRNSKFLEIIGEEYIGLAFQFAEEADPDVALYYNDYGLSLPAKRDGAVALVKKLQADGIRIDAVGMQGHTGLDYPAVEEFEKSILAFADLGVEVMITEFDMTVLPFPDQNVGAEISANFDYQAKFNPYTEGLPDSVAVKLEERLFTFFNLFDKHRDKISRVTLWGISDANSWRNDWPIIGRTDYPLLFDRQYQPKSVVEKIIEQPR